jgi:hypothetical protein
MVKILPPSSCRSHHYPHNKLKNAEKMFDFGQQKQAELLHYITIIIITTAPI